VARCHLLTFERAGYEAEAFVHRFTLIPGHLGALPQMRKCVNHVLGIECKLSVDKLNSLIHMLRSPRQGGHRASMVATIGLSETWSMWTRAGHGGGDEAEAPFCKDKRDAHGVWDTNPECATHRSRGSARYAPRLIQPAIATGDHSQRRRTCLPSAGDALHGFELWHDWSARWT